MSYRNLVKSELRATFVRPNKIESFYCNRIHILPLYIGAFPNAQSEINTPAIAVLGGILKGGGPLTSDATGAGATRDGPS